MLVLLPTTIDFSLVTLLYRLLDHRSPITDNRSLSFNSLLLYNNHFRWKNLSDRLIPCLKNLA